MNRSFDVHRLRSDFPILGTSIRGKRLVYLDNAATTQKPRKVLETVREYNETLHSNIHRGVHHLSEQATRAYEGARERVRRYLRAADAREIVFVRGTTEAINLVARSFVRPRLRPGDEILITHMEHHSNIVPWQMIRDETGAVLRTAPINDRGEVVLEEVEKLLGPRTRIFSVTHVSNVLGTVNPVRRLAEMARARGIPVLVDGAQAAAHRPIDVCALGCDFYAFSGHKVYGPTGIGTLYAKAEHLEAMPPWQGGGDMILSVTLEKSTYNRIPHKFEAGTPPIEGAVGLGAALEYVSEEVGLDVIAAHERDLLAYARERLGEIAGLRLVGAPAEQAGVLSFVLEGLHPHDVGTILDREGIAIRTGHHCAQPLMERLGLPATARASFGLYNTREDVDALVEGLRRVREVFPQ